MQKKNVAPINLRVKNGVIASISLAVTTILFWIPFYFVVLNSFKNSQESSLLNLTWPSSFQIIENYKHVLTIKDFIVLKAFYNSMILTVLSIFILVFVSSMAGFVMQRREGGKGSSTLNFLILTGLMIPPAIVPTIWTLDGIGLFKTLTGITLVEVALHFPFCVILYKAFMATVPRELDESAFIDGCGGLRLYFNIVFPLLKPVTSTLIVLQSLNIFNDFVNPLYFFPGADNATVQLTLYNFMSEFQTSWNYLFADVVLITIPPLILFLFFNKRIVAGMTAGAVKG